MAFTNPLYQLLGKSPIKPLQEHMTEAVRCAQLLEEFFRLLLAMTGPAQKRFITASASMKPGPMN